jgi:hypothetical protein
MKTEKKKKNGEKDERNLDWLQIGRMTQTVQNSFKAGQ